MRALDASSALSVRPCVHFMEKILIKKKVRGTCGPLFLKKMKTFRNKNEKKMRAFHMERAAYHRSVGAHSRAERHEAHAFGASGSVGPEGEKRLEHMPDNAILNIIEHLDYDLGVLSLSKRFDRIIPRGNVANYIARKLVTCAPDHALHVRKKGMWLPDACVDLNVHRILDVVMRGANAANDARSAHVKPLRDAIMRLATSEGDEAHHALLVRAPFFRMIEHLDDRRITPAIKDAARELFDALRPSIEAAIRSERIGTRHLYAKATDKEMRRLVDSIGLSPLKSYRDLAGAVVGYVRDHVGLRASRLRSGPSPGGPVGNLPIGNLRIKALVCGMWMYTARCASGTRLVSSAAMASSPRRVRFVSLANRHRIRKTMHERSPRWRGSVPTSIGRPTNSRASGPRSHTARSTAA